MTNFRAHNLRLASQRLSEAVAALLEALVAAQAAGKDKDEAYRGIAESIRRLEPIQERIDEVTVEWEGRPTPPAARSG